MATDIKTFFTIAANVTGMQNLKSLDRALGGLKAAAGALGVTLSVGWLASFVKDSLDAVGGLGELADQLGVTTTTLQAFQYGASQVGLSSEEMQTGIAKLTRSIGEAAEGSETAIKAFNRIGVGVLDAAGKVRSTDAVMGDVADALKAIDDPARRAAIAVDLFGKTGQKMLPFLQDGKEGVNNLASEAESLGMIIDDPLVRAADDASDSITALSGALEKNLQKGIARTAPQISWLAGKLKEIVEGTNILTGQTDQEWQASIRLIQLTKDRAAALEQVDYYTKQINDANLQDFQREYAKQQLEAAQKTINEINRTLIKPRGGRPFAQSLPDPFAGGGDGGGAYNPPPSDNGAAKKAADEAERRAEAEARAVQELRRGLFLLQDHTSVEKVLWEIKNGELATASDERKALAVQKALTEDMIDAEKELAEQDSERLETLLAQDEAHKVALNTIRDSIAAYRDQAAAIGLSRKEAEKLAFLNDLRKQVASGAITESDMADLVGEWQASQDAIAAAQGNWLNGARTALLDYADETRNIAGQIGSALTNAFGKAEDALLDFVKTGKFNFKDLVNSLLDDLGRMAIRYAITGPLASIFGGMGGSGGGGIGGLLGSIFGGFRADGGPVTAGVPYIVGERRPELFIPNQSGRIMPSVPGSSGPVQISVTVNNHGGNVQSDQKATGERGVEIGKLIGNKVREIMADESRPGGLLNRRM